MSGWLSLLLWIYWKRLQKGNQYLISPEYCKFSVNFLHSTGNSMSYKIPLLMSLLLGFQPNSVHVVFRILLFLLFLSVFTGSQYEMYITNGVLLSTISPSKKLFHIHYSYLVRQCHTNFIGDNTKPFFLTRFAAWNFLWIRSNVLSLVAEM